MDMMSAEEARLSSDGLKEDDAPIVNSDIVAEPISDPENKFQKAIAAWRGMYHSTGILVETMCSFVCRH